MKAQWKQNGNHQWRIQGKYYNTLLWKDNAGKIRTKDYWEYDTKSETAWLHSYNIFHLSVKERVYDTIAQAKKVERERVKTELGE